VEDVSQDHGVVGKADALRVCHQAEALFTSRVTG
jgi:hypothetical protein